MTPGQIITPKEMPIPLRIRYNMKLQQWGIHQGIQGVKYDGIQSGPQGDFFHFTVMDEIHPSFCVPVGEL